MGEQAGRDAVRRAGAVRVSADRGRCLGAGQCALAAGAVFDQDDDGFVVVRDPAPHGAGAEAARLAERLCPTGAISVREPG